VEGQLHALAALPPRKEPQHPSNMRLSGAQTSSGCFSTSDRPLPGIYTDYTVPALAHKGCKKISEPKTGLHKLYIAKTMHFFIIEMYQLMHHSTNLTHYN
jgi:hypothetical protein